MSFTGGALKACEGDFVRAEHLLDCSIFEYYYRLVERKNWVTWHNEQMKPKT